MDREYSYADDCKIAIYSKCLCITFCNSLSLTFQIFFVFSNIGYHCFKVPRENM